MNTLADEPEREKRLPRMRKDHLFGASGNHLFGKVELASFFATTLTAYNGTPAQPQTQAMGAARRNPLVG